ncbi:S-layer homology domain-containing protein [Paenibacillus sp. HJGM_3]|uniref:S-layer homology domain-containing protein n=1 Tax=Paenibacillus sp. HJGM_3 TaxID=3379816 RepID=UPI00385D1EA7
MKMFKKVAATSIAASLVASGIVGVPLSSKGFSYVLGVQQASAAGLPPSAATLKNKLDKVYAKLVATGNAGLVTSAQTELGNITDLDLRLGNVWTKIATKAAVEGKSQAEIDQFKSNLGAIASLITGLSLASSDSLNVLRETHYNDFKFLADITGHPTPDFEDVTALVLALETSLKSLATPANISNPTELLTQAVEDAIKSVLNASSTNTAKIIKDMGVSVDDILTAKNQLQAVMPSLKNASIAIAAAYLAVIRDENTTPDPDPETNPNPTPSTGGAGGVVSQPDQTGIGAKELEEVLGNVQKELDEIFKSIPDLTKLTDENLEQLLGALVAAIEKISTLDLSKSVEVKDDVAKPKLDETALAKQFDNISKNVDKVNEKAGKALDGAGEKPKVTATINLGTVNAKTTEIPISKSLVEKAIASGIDSIAFKVNGVTLAFSVDDLKNGNTLTIQKQDNTAATQVTDKKLASDVFTLELSSGTTFSNAVEVKFPITSTNGLDTALLVLAKIINGKLEFYGGAYDPETKTFSATRKSFSTYTVVENKVAFNDMASVKDWAGRQVEVTAAKGLIEGRADGVFAPNEQVTRAEFAKMIVKAFGLEDATAKESFKDVNDSDWFSPYVAAAAKAGIINGRSADEFAPNAPISRVELATMAARALKLAKNYKDADVATALKDFKDASSIADSLKSGVALAASKGIIIGESEGQFNPNGVSTRAQAAVVLYRLINK